MKTLILNGSPRPEGDTAALLHAFTQELDGGVFSVSAYYGGISPCVDCRFCWQHPGCAIDDSMQQVYDYLAVCDNVVIASPLHFSLLTGPLLSVASRLQTFYAAKAFRKDVPCLPPKKGVLILTGGGNGAPDPAVRAARTLFSCMNARMVAQVVSLRTDVAPAAQDANALEQARQAARMLSRPVNSFDPNPF